jgi:DNA-binding NarL/FixJ family response regulator
MGKKYRILIVEDEPLIAEDIAGYLMEADFEIAGMAHDAEEALQLLEVTNPDGVLLDINLGDGMDGIGLAKIIREKYGFPFVYLTSHSDKATLERAKRTIPAGYLLKPFNGNDLMISLEIAIFNQLQSRGVSKPELSLDDLNDKLPVPLSQREFEILNLLKKGKTNKEIAAASFVSVNTVKTHLAHLFEKLDVSNRTQALFRINELQV